MRLFGFLLMAGLTGGCASWASQLKGDLDAVLPQCTREATITLCQCAARVERDRQCREMVGQGKVGDSLPPACREAAASQPKK